MRNAYPPTALRELLAKLQKQMNPLVRATLADLPILLDQYIEHVEARLLALEGLGPVVRKAEQLVAIAKTEGQL